MTPMDNTVTASMDSQGTVQLNVLKDNQSYSRVKKLSCFHKVQEKQKFQKINPSCSVDWTMHWKVCRVDWMAEQCYLINFLKTLKFRITEWRSFLMWIWAAAQYVHASLLFRCQTFTCLHNAPCSYVTR